MPKFPKQTQATNYIKSLLASRGIQLEPGIVVFGEAEGCQVFEYRKRCLAIDTKSGLWIGHKGQEWRCIDRACTVGSALQGIEFLLKD